MLNGERDANEVRAEVCVFCAIVAGALPASVVYADEYSLAFLSLEQPNPYKTLVIPRAHVPSLYDLTDEEAARLIKTALRVARAIRDVAGAPGLNLVQSNGRFGQQDVFHVHLHLIPRVLGDTADGRVTLAWDETTRDRAELDRLAAALRARLGQSTG
ncbi:MAG: HIT family protein [Ktedonobacterales bacterium]